MLQHVASQAERLALVHTRAASDDDCIEESVDRCIDARPSALGRNVRSRHLGGDQHVMERDDLEVLVGQLTAAVRLPDSACLSFHGGRPPVSQLNGDPMGVLGEQELVGHNGSVG